MSNFVQDIEQDVSGGGGGDNQNNEGGFDQNQQSGGNEGGSSGGGFMKEAEGAGKDAMVDQGELSPTINLSRYILVPQPADPSHDRGQQLYEQGRCSLRRRWLRGQGGQPGGEQVPLIGKSIQTRDGG